MPFSVVIQACDSTSPLHVEHHFRNGREFSSSTGASRYRKDYYGIFVAAALARLYERSGDVALFGSHPPGDVGFRDELMQAAVGSWHVEVGGKERAFRVTYANTFDEPVGGLMNVILAEDGQHYKRTDVNGGRALVIDIGGRAPGGAYL